jgi:hypothetical protein
MIGLGPWWSRASKRARARAVLLPIVVVLLGGFAWRGADTLERGNRLFRRGAVEAAADVYAARIDTTRLGQVASFNLGNALAAFGSPQAERYLLRAAEASDSVVAQSAHYNLGHRLLDEADGDLDPYAAIPLLAAAIRHNRAALVLDPEDEDARWNLALALRAFDDLPIQDFDEAPIEEEIDTDQQLSENEEENAGESELDEAEEGTEGAEEDDDLALSTAVAPAVGSPEALASGDPGPMSPEDAMELIEGAGGDLEVMVRGLLWSLRPQPREGRPAQGGNW